ncbi:hypothetical protein ABD83_12685 [Bacillus xiamenensis]|uniref:Serine/threonine protein kinase n=1 Tax=Bacillus xiamenensis TaxID=1178537 RepID=A0ABT4F6R5_9BACI|nr:serine/threonine-protein kinase [Bacillus xiamenensis]MBG9912255.1 hypothetical protein [Bacillus xiamenensis]MCY9576353.1 serine/threonine protein kinase [Bacillus xiamenensis]
MESVIEQYLKENTDMSISDEVIGIGGMKKVYMGHINSQNIDCVVKVVEVNSTNSEKRTRRELEILKSLDSDFFPKIYDVFEKKDSHGNKFIIIIEQFIDGSNLREYIKEKEIDEKEAIEISYQLMLALQIVHQKGLVHRDVKPENIMLTKDSKVVLLDFGIARDLIADSITSDLSPYGPMTVGYAAPEQIHNKKRLISARTDFFSWAVVFVELLNGKNLLKEGTSTPSEVINRTLKLNEHLILIKCTDIQVEQIIRKNLNSEVHRRSNSELEILKVLEAS